MLRRGACAHLSLLRSRMVSGKHSRCLCGPGDGLGACAQRGGRQHDAIPAETSHPCAANTQPGGGGEERTKMPPSLSSIQWLGAFKRFRCFFGPRGIAGPCVPRPLKRGRSSKAGGEWHARTGNVSTFSTTQGLRLYNVAQGNVSAAPLQHPRSRRRCSNFLNFIIITVASWAVKRRSVDTVDQPHTIP